MDFILDIAEFLLQAIILLGVFLVAFAGVMALSQRKRGAGEDGTVEVRSLNERFEMHEEAALANDPREAFSRALDDTAFPTSQYDAPGSLEIIPFPRILRSPNLSTVIQDVSQAKSQATNPTQTPPWDPAQGIRA